MRTYKKGSHSSHQQVIVYIILLYYLYFKKQQLTCLGTNVCLLYLVLLCHLSRSRSKARQLLIGYSLKPSSVQFRHSVMFNCLWPHGLQHTRLSCPLPIPRVCSNSCPSNRWCHPTISSSFTTSFTVLYNIGHWLLDGHFHLTVCFLKTRTVFIFPL